LFNKAQSKQDILDVMKEIGKNAPRLQDFHEAELIDFADPIVFAKKLATVFDEVHAEPGLALSELVKYPRSHQTQ
jgi:hypothetical protein